MFERANTVHALDRAATVIGTEHLNLPVNLRFEVPQFGFLVQAPVSHTNYYFYSM
jgi:hypothetical protein